MIDTYLYGLRFDSKKASAKLRALGGDIKSAGILSALTPDITIPGKLAALWVFYPMLRRGPGYLNMFNGFYSISCGGRAPIVHKGSTYMVSLLAAKLAGAKLTGSAPLPLP